MTKDDQPPLTPGETVTVQGHFGVYRGPNPHIAGDVWVEFPGTGWWSYDPSDVTPLPPTNHD